jgi:plasmid stabilization system protein ParE
VARLVWTREGIDSLHAAGEFLDQSSSEYARAFVSRVVDATERLALFPLLGRVVPELDREDIRELIFQNFRIVYRVVGTEVRIYLVIHGAVDVGARLRGEPWILE